MIIGSAQEASYRRKIPTVPQLPGSDQEGRPRQAGPHLPLPAVLPLACCHPGPSTAERGGEEEYQLGAQSPRGRSPRPSLPQEGTDLPAAPPPGPASLLFPTGLSAAPSTVPSGLL